ncbi:signal recognition particle receptor subunit alpha [Candidatus Walczuchella monophlebidarum]|uniref:signal recognition particle receptor subunit alpha n=1 Tax=Candidatus Walczuchella monophlebidarum TaxID=1415657 RepID=UPI000571BE49|nr:signal recognition particle receptor subunit alpha [Candidatus Walczuchella monophlebidarum]
MSKISEPIKELRRVLLNADVNLKVAKKVLIKIVHSELVELLGLPGKTTFSVKLASYLSSKERKNPLLVSVDISRPAAIEQLKKSYARVKCNDVLIIDHAGRIDEALMNEIKYLYQERCRDSFCRQDKIQ